MKTNFTPGPWCVCNSTDIFTDLGAINAAGCASSHNDGWQIADCNVGLTSVKGAGWERLTLEEQKANARLIAAAPALYEALEALRIWAYDTMAAQDKAVPLVLAADVEHALAAARGEA